MATTLTTCEDCAARCTGICRALESTELAGLRQTGVHRRFGAGQIIIREGDPITSIASVISGIVKLTHETPSGRRQIVSLLLPGDFLGRPFTQASPFGAEAVTDVELCSHQRSQFEQLMKETPQLEHCLLMHILDNLDDARSWIVWLGSKSACARVASLLDLFARRRPVQVNRETGAIRFELALSRAEIAECLGLRLETVSRQLSRLKAMGVIRLEGEHMISIPHPEQLRAAAEIEGD